MEDKKHSFMDQLNLFFIGAVIGAIVGPALVLMLHQP